MTRLATVPLLRRLLGNIEHPGDLLPRCSVSPGACHGIRECRFGGLSNHAQELNKVKRGLMQGCADGCAVSGNHVALVKESLVCVRHASRLVDSTSECQPTLTRDFSSAGGDT